MFKKIVFSFLCLMIFSQAYALDYVRKDIKVGILLNVDSFTAASTKDFTITDAKGRKFKLSKGMVRLSYKDGSLLAGNYTLEFPVLIESSAKIVFADKKPYRGCLTVNKAKNKINVINVLSIEDYTKGVLPKEASPGWHIEAQKAQSVISRTYTIANLNKHSGQGFDMCSTTHCQVYGGAGAEALQSNKAVVATTGEVLTYAGKFAQTVFHANCGGRTEDPRYVWNWKSVTPVYLEGVKCGYCAKAPHAYWEKSLDESFIRQKLSAYKVGKIKSIKVKGVTPAGSAKELEINHAGGNLTINAYKFRLAVDAWQVKSTTYDSIKKDGDKFVFKGRGWGHKVGLCQWGAKGMADSGKKYKTILQHYYPKTKLEKVKYK